MKGVYFVRENLSKSHHIYYDREVIGDVHGFLTMEGKDEKGILNLLFIDSVNSKKLTDEIMKEVKAGKAKGGERRTGEVIRRKNGTAAGTGCHDFFCR